MGYMSELMDRARHRINVNEYHKMSDAGVFGQEDRLELIEGEIIDMAPIGSQHAYVVNQLVRLFTLTQLMPVWSVRKTRFAWATAPNHSPTSPCSGLATTWIVSPFNATFNVQGLLYGICVSPIYKILFNTLLGINLLRQI